MSLFWGHWYPCFGFLVMFPLGFKARVGSALFALRRWNVVYISQDPPLATTCADLLAAGLLPVLSTHTVAEVSLLGFELVLSEYL